MHGGIGAAALLALYAFAFGERAARAVVQLFFVAALCGVLWMVLS